MTEAIAGKHSINLLRIELIPVKPLWSLKRVGIVWLIVAIAMVSWAFLSQHQVTEANQTFSQLKNEKRVLNDTLSTVEITLEQHQPSNKLKDKIDLLALILNNKTKLHKELTDTSKTQVAGFAQSMTELSENHLKGISLSVVQINNDGMTFVGVTKSAQLVPAWLASFENSTFLSGKRFTHFFIHENEQKDIEFTVSSKANTEALNNE